MINLPTRNPGPQPLPQEPAAKSVAYRARRRSVPPGCPPGCPHQRGAQRFRERVPPKAAIETRRKLEGWSDGNSVTLFKRTRSDQHTSDLQSLMRNTSDVLCLITTQHTFYLRLIKKH